MHKEILGREGSRAGENTANLPGVEGIKPQPDTKQKSKVWLTLLFPTWEGPAYVARERMAVDRTRRNSAGGFDAWVF